MIPPEKIEPVSNAEKAGPLTREERIAKKLRENLGRRKNQKRERTKNSSKP